MTLRSTLPLWHRLLLAAGWLLPLTGQALDFGPFSLTGFAKGEVQQASNQCTDCQRFPGEDKQRFWADELVPGQPYGTEVKHVTLFQPWLGAKFDLGGGFRLSGLISQRLRDGKEDIPGFWYDKNLALSHEDWGSLRVGAMTTRAWSVADYPYGTQVGVADVWASSGAGYGLLARALRYTSRLLDVADGDLVLEASWDRGNSHFKQHAPRFWELYAQYHRGDWVVDAMYQDSRNGNPQAWGHGPFDGPSASAADDAKLGSSGQSIALLMARYQFDSRLELSGGLRKNRWSGAYAVITQPGPPALWNNMFNVDWNGTLNGVANPGYAASSIDWMLGARYRWGDWTASTGMVHLGQAQTDNPSERGQSNSATINSLGLSYELGHGVQLYGLAGRVQFRQLGLSPMSMPGNAAFTGVDSRVTTSGNWFGLGAVWVF